MRQPVRRPTADSAPGRLPRGFLDAALQRIPLRSALGLLVLVTVSACKVGDQRDTAESQPGRVGDRQPGPAAQVQPERAAEAQPSPVGRAGRWSLVFSDGFDGQRLDANKWVTCYWWGSNGCTNLGNKELQWYQPDEVLVSDGVLRLRAQKRAVRGLDGKIYEYTSGMVTTGRDTDQLAAPPKFTFRYGYAEIRARVPNGRGLWPAFWMMPSDHESLPELDVMEMVGHEPTKIYMHLHFLADPATRIDSTGGTWTGPDFSAGWHTFAVDWRQDVVIWYVDGVDRMRSTSNARVPAEPMYILLNLAVGGRFAGPVDDATSFPSYFEIDYVRVWEQDPTGPESGRATPGGR